MGWLLLGIIAAGAALLLWVFGMARSVGIFAAAALLMGAGGYALQGRPHEWGNPVEHTHAIQDVDPSMLALRKAFFGEGNFENAYFTAAEALERSGATQEAVAVMLGAIKKAPNDAALWTGLGNAYVAHSGGELTPAVTLAFTHALALAPDHPGPLFFYGLALLQSGRFGPAAVLWHRSLALTPVKSDAYAAIELRLRLLEQYMVMQTQSGDDGPNTTSDGEPSESLSQGSGSAQ